MEIDRSVVASNLRAFRALHGLSQKDVAQRAGLAVRTVYAIEQGLPVYRDSLERVCTGLRLRFEQAISVDLFANVKTPGKSFVVHDPARMHWYTVDDRRRNVPENNDDLIQDPRERHRLGIGKLVAAFVSGLDLLMPLGPGMLLYEVYGEFRVVVPNYASILFYGLRGELRVTVDGVEVALPTGGAVGLGSTETILVAPSRPPRFGEAPPLLQYVGANRAARSDAP